MPYSPLYKEGDSADILRVPSAEPDQLCGRTRSGRSKIGRRRDERFVSQNRDEMRWSTSHPRRDDTRFGPLKKGGRRDEISCKPSVPTVARRHPGWYQKKEKSLFTCVFSNKVAVRTGTVIEKRRLEAAVTRGSIE